MGSHCQIMTEIAPSYSSGGIFLGIARRVLNLVCSNEQVYLQGGYPSRWRYIGSLLFSTFLRAYHGMSIHGSHDPSIETRDDSPQGEFCRILV